MTNHIRQLQLQDRVVNPAEAEIWVTVVPDQPTPTTELRGRLTGPRCPYSTTVEVAYPLRPLARPPQGQGGLTMRVVIPEPSLWDPISPFLYDGPIELWQDGERCDAVQVRHGLRWFSGTVQRFRLNGHPLTLVGAERDRCSDEEARRLRKDGVNTWVVPVREDTRALWDLADRLGFLVIGRIPTRPGPVANQALPPSDQHPSCLGWLLDLDDPNLSETVAALTAARPQTWIGVELHRVPEALPEGLHFVLCPEELLPLLTSTELPKLVRTATGVLAAVLSTKGSQP